MEEADLVKTGTDLIRDINACKPGYGELTLWWLGQHSFVVKLGEHVIYLDPFLSEFEGREVPPLLSPRDVTNASIVMGSHDHEDHIDRAAWPDIASASPDARFVVPDILVDDVSRSTGISTGRFVGLDDAKSVDLDGVKITGIASAHEFLDRDPATGRYPYLGFVVEANGCTIYHSGDCCVYEGLLTKLKQWKFDAVFLPINGRDAKRYANGCIGNMTYQEAVDLAGELGPRHTIPAHYEMFSENSEDPNLFVRYMEVKYPKLDVIVPRHGEKYVISKMGR